MSRAYYNAAVPNFLVEDEASILGQLTRCHGFSLERQQRDAWIWQIQHLKAVLQEHLAGHLIGEMRAFQAVHNRALHFAEMQRDPETARQFYDLLRPLADHSDEQIRCAVAWCMGEDDSHYPPFHEALRELASDEAPAVRYNAALALSRLGDPMARPVLREMLTEPQSSRKNTKLRSPVS